VVKGTVELGDLRVGEVTAMTANSANGHLYVSHPHTPTITVVSGTAVLTRVAVLSPGGRLEVNPSTGLVYVRHPGAPFVTVLSNTAALTQVEVPGGNGPIEANPSTGVIYAVDGDSSVAVLREISHLGSLPSAFPQPRSMEVHPLTGQVVVLSDPPALSYLQGDSIVATVPLSAAPGKMLIHPDSGLIYLTLPREDSVLIVSGTMNLATLPTSGTPNDIAFQPNTDLLYVPDSSGILNVLSGTERIASLPLGSSLARVAAKPETGWVYVTEQRPHRVHILTGTEAVTVVETGFYPYAVAVEPRSGYTYVGGENGYVLVLSATQVVTSLQRYGWTITEMRASPSTGLVYLHQRPYSPGSQCERIDIIRGLGITSSWFSFMDKRRFTSIEPHPSRSYVYVGQASRGGYLTIGVGTALAQTLSVGDGSWIRAVAIDPKTDLVYVATDHAISILETRLPHRHYLPLLYQGHD
jgi:DNA-binding beta-propeller fold protein YncE